MSDGKLEFQSIYADFQPKIQRYLTRLVGEDEAEDLTQETFVKVDQALEGFRGDSRLSTWIYRIATNTALDRMRSPSFQRGAHQSQCAEPPLIDMDEIAECDPLSGELAIPLERQCVKSEMSACLLSYIEKLPENYRTVLLLSDLEQLSNREIADILKISLETVKIRLHRARERLRDELMGHCEFYWAEELSWRVI